MKTTIEKLIEYFEQQLRLQRESSIKYTGEEAFFDALDVCKNAYRTEQSQQKQSGYRVVSKDEWFAMRTDERHQLVAGRDLKTGEAIWLAENKPEPQKQSAVWVKASERIWEHGNDTVVKLVHNNGTVELMMCKYHNITWCVPMENIYWLDEHLPNHIGETNEMVLTTKNKANGQESCKHEWVSYKQCCYCGAYQNGMGKIN